MMAATPPGNSTFLCHLKYTLDTSLGRREDPADMDREVGGEQNRLLVKCFCDFPSTAKRLRGGVDQVV